MSRPVEASSLPRLLRATPAWKSKVWSCFGKRERAQLPSKLRMPGRYVASNQTLLSDLDKERLRCSMVWSSVRPSGRQLGGTVCFALKDCFWISRAVVSEEICLFLGAVAGRKEASLDENPVNGVFAVDICPGGVGVLC